MRVLAYIDTWDLVGGSERYGRLAVASLRERGHVVRVVCARSVERDDSGADVESNPGFAGPGLPSSARDDLRVRVRSFAPDVIAVLSCREPKLLRALLDEGPVVRFVQDHTLFCPGLNKMHEDGTACGRPVGVECLQRYFATSGCTGFKRERGSTALLAPLHRLGARMRDLEAHARCEALVVASGYMRDELVRAGIAPGKIVVVPYFTDAAEAGEARHPLPAATEEFLAAGRGGLVLTPARLVLPDKGVDHLITALGHVRVPFRAVVAGSGPAEAWLREKARVEGLGDRVHFAGWLDARSIGALYARCDVVAFPSVWNEPFGLVGLEAMARAKPVVAFDVGGVAEWLEDGVTGLAVARRNTRAFAEGIERLLQDRELAARMGRAGFERLGQRFRRDAHVACLERLFAQASARACQAAART